MLECHDILATIFDHLAPGSVTTDDIHEAEVLSQTCRKALKSSAIVCSTISHHALNAMWRELHSLHPLLRVLPNYKRVGSRFVSCSSTMSERDSRFTKSVARHSVGQSYLNTGRDFGSMLIACGSSMGSKNQWKKLSSPLSGCSSPRSARVLR